MTPLIFALLVFVGGTNAAVVKFAVGQFSPIILVLVRSLISIVILFPFALKTKRVTLSRKSAPLFFINFLFAANWVTFALGIQKTTVIMAQLIYVPTALVVGLIGFLILKKKFTKTQLLGLIITMCGAILLILGSTSGGSLTFGNSTGNLLITSGMFFWAFYLVFSEKISNSYSPLTIIFYNFIIAFVVASILISTIYGAKIISLGNISPSGFLSLAYIVIFSSVIYFYVNQWFVKHTSAFIASLTIYPMTLVASSTGIIFYGEKLTPNLIAAAILITLGVFIATSYNYLKDKVESKSWTFQ